MGGSGAQLKSETKSEMAQEVETAGATQIYLRTIISHSYRRSRGIWRHQAQGHARVELEFIKPDLVDGKQIGTEQKKN